MSDLKLKELTFRSVQCKCTSKAPHCLNGCCYYWVWFSPKKDLTGAVTSIKAKDFNQGVINSPDQLLQKKVPGLEITNTSGQPGAATTIQIRGTYSIRAGNNPLYVVDGVPLDGGTARPVLGNAFGSTPNSDPLIFIDPNTIQQIDVQKDASGTAIYGSRALTE